MGAASQSEMYALLGRQEEGRKHFSHLLFLNYFQHNPYAKWHYFEVAYSDPPHNLGQVTTDENSITSL